MKVKDIRIEDFNYPLPDDRIASHPVEERDHCKLLVCDGGRIADHRFDELPELLPAGALLVCNNTRVINARLHFRRLTGALIEVFLLEPYSPADYAENFSSTTGCKWVCLVGNLKRWKPGEILTKHLTLTDGREVTLSVDRGEPMPGNAHVVSLSWDDEGVTFADIVDAAGRIPIPPYLCRESEDSDAEDYQTIYSKIRGSVAAPTAGLHFTENVFAELEKRGLERREVTLHVGAGTFQPVKSDNIGDHPMHTEVISVSRALIQELADAVKDRRPIVAVGTTSVRTLESLPWLAQSLLNGGPAHVSQWDAYEQTDFDTEEALRKLADLLEKSGKQSLSASTAIMIAPGYKWRVVTNMVTNFHQPESTLLLLVSSFLGLDQDGKPQWREVYNHAMQNGYRFLSYGDSCYFKQSL